MLKACVQLPHYSVYCYLTAAVGLKKKSRTCLSVRKCVGRTIEVNGSASKAIHNMPFDVLATRINKPWLRAVNPIPSKFKLKLHIQMHVNTENKHQLMHDNLLNTNESQ